MIRSGLIVWAIAALGLTQSFGSDILDWTELRPIPNELGVAGPFTGVHEDTLIVAGGANFPLPVWDTDKVWFDDVYALSLQDENAEWVNAGKLPRPTGYGACVNTPDGIVCIGGNDAKGTFDSVFLMKWADGKVEIESLPSAPAPIVYGAAAMIGSYIYVAGGTTEAGLETAQKNFWRLDWSKRSDPDSFQWEELEAWPGPERGFNTLTAQSNGQTACLYLIGGRHLDAQGKTEFLKDVYEFDPDKSSSPWRRRADLPNPRAAGAAAAFGQSHIFVLSGADGSLFETADDLKDKHPGFPKTIYAYHTITDTWIDAGTMPQNQVTTHAVPWGNDVLLASGEIRPRVRTPKIWKIEARSVNPPFATGNWIAILLYLGAIMGVGLFFTKRNKNTDDFFRGGQRVPGWVAGLSIFATMLSSITFVAVPAKAFATDWVFIVVNAGIVICAPLVVWGVIPRFRQMNVTSAYEFLEDRFNLFIRLFASASFILFQIGRMAIVMYLPALALDAVTPISLETCILIMGLLSIAYCAMGGLEAVVWTDALQAIVLLGGAGVSFFVILNGLDGGWSELASVATADHKTRWADFDWSKSSYISAAFWVILLGGIGSSLIPYSSDQAVIQRYVSTPTEQKAKSAVWLNVAMSVVSTILFFGLGTALYAFYKARPEALNPTFKTDSIFPLFISRELPVGVAGIVIAAVFAAAQSTISTSMNSTSTALVTDFFRRFGWKSSEAGYLWLARILTVLLGAAGTGFALLLAWSDIESAWQSFLTIIGFAMGPLCGIFLLGMFAKSANAKGAVAGAAIGVAILVWAKYGSEMNGLLYAPLGIAASFAGGLIFSRILK